MTMWKLFALIIVSLAVQAVAFDFDRTCDDQISVLKDEKDLTQLIREQSLKTQTQEKLKEILEKTGYTKSQLSNNLLKCMEKLMRKGFFKVGQVYIDEILEPLEIESGEFIKNIGSQIKKEIDVLAVSSRRSVQETIPVFQWGQSNSSILMQIKFAHRFDSPGCVDITDELVKIENKTFFFSAYCIQANNPIKFVLNVTLFDDIIPESSHWKLESVGRMYVELAKKEEKLWIRLLETSEKMKQMQVWWELKGQHNETMDAYSKMLEDLEDQLAEDKKKKRKNKAKKRKTDDSGMDVSEEL